MSSLVFGLMPAISYALGLGEIRLHSHLNEPLEAEIALKDTKGIELTDIIATLAEPSAFQKEGLEVASWLNGIHFKVVRSTDGKTVIQLTTDNPVKDPFADLLVQATWPDGKIIKEYTLLLDPPKASSANQPLVASVSVRKKNAAVEEKITVTASAKGGKNTSFGGQYGPVYHETLWSIAKKLVAKSPFTVHQGVAAIVEKNPQAFKNGNMHQMIQGVVLNLPTEEELSRQVALDTKQKGHITSSEQTQSGAVIGSLAAKGIEEAPKPLTLVNQPSSADFSENGNKLKENQNISSTTPVSQRLTMIEEALDTLKRSNEGLQHQNETLITQLAQKEAEINRLRTAMKNTPELAEHPLISQESIKPPTHEGFAVVVPDYPKKAKVEPPIEQKVAANSALSGLPKDILTKDKQQNSAEVSKKLNQNLGDENYPTTKSSSHAKSDVIYFIFIFILSCSIVGWLWFSRQSLLSLANAISERFVKKARLYLQKKSPSPVSTHPISEPLRKKQTEVERVEIGQTNFDLPFDLNKALNAVVEEEKLAVRERRPEEQVESIISSASIEDADIYIAYERYPQAERILLEILEHHSDAWEALLKLLELYVLTEKYDDYKKWYARVPKELKDISPIIWSKIALLQEKVQMEKSIDVGSKIVNDTTSSSVFKFELEALDDKQQEIAQKDLPVPNVEISEPIDKPKAQKEMPKISIGSSEPRIKNKPLTQKDLPKPLVEISEQPLQDETAKTTSVKLELVKEPEDWQSQLSLAKAYIDVGDIEPARDILVNILSQGTPAQAKEAQALLDRINKT